MKQKELGIYIHIPFCKGKCYYCDFTSYTSQSEEKIASYIRQVIKEMNLYDFSKYHVTTIYIGGGTPSFIDEKYIEQLMKELKIRLLKNETKWEDIEITIEVNPGTITRQKLERYKKVGINRLSIGLQSTKDKILKQIGRIHNYQDFIQTYELASKIGFDNINVDLMIGLPNQTIQEVKETLEEIKRLQPNHVSIYSLIVEEKTKISELLNKGKLQLPKEELERQMYWYVKNTLELNGYQHYEISNFAKKGKESNHNKNCWEQKEYIGLGVTAHSYLDGVRFSNQDFLELEQWDFSDKIIEEKQTLEEKRKEYMLLGLRKIEGVSICSFKEKYGANPLFMFQKELNKLVKQGLLIVDGDWIRLTNKGLDFANLVWEEFV